VKHQNIKVNEKVNFNAKEEGIKNKEALVKKDLLNQKSQENDKQKEFQNILDTNSVEDVRNSQRGNFKNTDKDINKIHQNMNIEKININSQNSIPILLETKKNKRINKDKKKEMNGIIEDDIIRKFYDTDKGQDFEENERIIWQLSD